MNQQYVAKPGTNKAINEIDMRTAKTIFHDIMKLNPRSFTDTQIKTRVRTYLRGVKLSPADAIEIHRHAIMNPHKPEKVTPYIDLRKKVNNHVKQ